MLQSIVETSKLLRKRELSPVELTKECLAQIEKLNPTLNAFITVSSELALEQARTAEDFEEAKRLFYVGVTRAKRFLLYVTDDSERRNGPSRFLCAGTGIGVC